MPPTKNPDYNLITALLHFSVKSTSRMILDTAPPMQNTKVTVFHHIPILEVITYHSLGWNTTQLVSWYKGWIEVTSLSSSSKNKVAKLPS